MCPQASLSGVLGAILYLIGFHNSCKPKFYRKKAPKIHLGLQSHILVTVLHFIHFFFLRKKYGGKLKKVLAAGFFLIMNQSTKAHL